MVESLKEYARLSETQKSKVKREQLKLIVDNQLKDNERVPLDVNTDDIRDVITEVVSAAVENVLAIKIKEIVEEITGILKTETIAISKDVTTLREELTTFADEHKVIKKVIFEQQKCLESLKREKIRNNVFISGIPNSTTINGVVTTDDSVIVKHVLSYLLPDIAQEDYNIDKAFEPKVGFTRHSAIISFTRYEKKVGLLGKSKELKTRTDENHWLRKVFIRSEQTPLTSKENLRMYGEFKKLRDQHVDDNDTVVKLEKGKLLINDVVVDEFNLMNQIF